MGTVRAINNRCTAALFFFLIRNYMRFKQILFYLSLFIGKSCKQNVVVPSFVEFVKMGKLNLLKKAHSYTLTRFPKKFKLSPINTFIIFFFKANTQTYLCSVSTRCLMCCNLTYKLLNGTLCGRNMLRQIDCFCAVFGEDKCLLAQNIQNTKNKINASFE